MNTMCCLSAISHSKYVQSWHARARSIHEHMHIHFPGHYLVFLKVSSLSWVILIFLHYFSALDSWICLRTAVMPSTVQMWTPVQFLGASNLHVRQQETDGYRQKVSTKKLWANIHWSRQERKGTGNLIIVNRAKKNFREKNERTVCKDILTRRDKCLEIWQVWRSSWWHEGRL